MIDLENILDLYKNPRLKKAAKDFIGRATLQALGLPELHPSELYRISGIDILPVLGVPSGETYLASQGVRNYLENAGYKDDGLVVISKGPLYKLIEEGEFVTKTFEETDKFGDITLLFTPEEAQLLSRISPYSCKTVEELGCAEKSPYDLEKNFL